MQRSERRILTTHVGSLPRNPVLRDLLVRQERGEPIDRPELDRQVGAAVDRVVAKQLDAGIDIGNDGEQPRVGFSTYAAQRMRGFGGESKRPVSLDLLDHPDYGELLGYRRRNSSRIMNAPQAIAPVEYIGEAEAVRECEVFGAALERARPRAFTEPFMTAASPGVIACVLLNAHYPSHEAYVDALAAQMKKEYELIHANGYVLQIDAPDLAMERPRLFQKDSLDRFLQIAAHHVVAINRACAAIPRDRIRLHVCWGNYDGPHTHDVPLEPLLPILYKANVGALSIEMANPRHEHEWKAIKRVGFPEHMLLLPGVIDSTSNYVEHPEVVSDRIERAVEAIGDRTRVIASTDCGFGTFAGSDMVADSVVWAKLATLAEGARLASSRLWGTTARA
jgi:5-methyltetrahydropteroyltriglutamate--homocysteine methyltransferase